MKKLSKTPFKQKIVSVMILLIILVSISGFAAYQNFSHVVNSINDAGRPSSNLLELKDLMEDIRDAENDVKSFSLTQDTVYLSQYEDHSEKAESKLIHLYPKLQKQKLNIHVDSLKSFVGYKFNILDELLGLQNTFRVKNALNKVTDQIVQATEESNNAESNKKAIKKSNFFNRLVKNKRKPQNEEEDLIEVSEVYAQLEDVKSEEESEEQELLGYEFELVKRDKEITSAIQEIINEYEQLELQEIERKTTEASIVGKRTNSLIAIFCVCICLVLIFTTYIIINYVRNNNKYKKALKIARIEAEHLVITKERFVATVSHEIRTPMNVISGFTEQISKEALSPKQQEQLKIVQSASDHLLSLVNDVLDLTKLESNKVKLEKIGFQPKETVQEVISLLEPMSNQKQIEISLEVEKNVPGILKGDPFRLRQILLNIVGNAIKFTEEGSVKIKISSLLQNEQQTQLRIEVEDTGIGMNEKQKAVIFDEFEQASIDTTKKYGGTGLGLTITKKLVDMHQGTIRAESEAGQGTLINVEIPYEIGKESDLKLPELVDSSTPFDLSDKKILIADDEAFNRKLLISILSRYNAKITEVDNGLEAFNEVSKNNYDIVLMDIRMPELDGIEATKKIRSELGLTMNDLPIIAISAGVSKNDQKTYKASEINGFIAKPFKESQLVQTLLKTFKMSKEQDKNQTPDKLNNSTSNNLDLKELKAISNGDEAFYCEMLETFIAGTQEGLENLFTAMDANDLTQMGNIAHKICAPCKHIGAEKLYDLLKEIEVGAKDTKGKDASSFKQTVLEIEKEVKVVIEMVQKELKFPNFN